MNIYQKFSFLKNLSVFAKINLFLGIIVLVVIIGGIHISKLRNESVEINLSDQLTNKMQVYAQQIGLYSELVLREVPDSKVELEKAVSFFEKYLFTLRNGGVVFVNLNNEESIDAADAAAAPLVVDVEKEWNIIKENSDIVISHETFVGGTEMATGSFDALGNYNEMQVFKPIAPEVKSALDNIESHLGTFEFKINKLINFYGSEKIRIAAALGFVLIVYLLILLLVVGMGIFILRHTIIKRIYAVLHFSNEISVGNLQAEIEIKSEDEIGKLASALLNLKLHMRNAILFVNKIGSGNLTDDFKIQGDEDELGKSLIVMKEAMQHASEEEIRRKKEDEIRNWTTHGIAKFGELLRLNNDNINELAYNILANLIDYTQSDIGGIFIITEHERSKTIDLIACYAYDRRKFLSKRLEWGEGLIGRVLQEQKTIFITEIPEDYITISSGLGYSQPTCLVLTPLRNNDTLLGVIELASFKMLEQYQIDFIEKISESIASTIATVKINMTTARLLRESSEQTERLAQQEEEMRQNMEEMQATQEEAALHTKAMEGILHAINTSLGTYELDLRGRITEANDIYSAVLGEHRYNLIGKYHKDVVSSNFDSEEDYEAFYNQLRDGETHKVEFIYKTDVGEKVMYEVYNVIYDAYGDLSKILVLATDITESKRQASEIQQKLSEIQKIQSALLLKDEEQEQVISILKKESEQQIEEIRAAEESLNQERQSRMEQTMAKEFELQAKIDLLERENAKLRSNGVIINTVDEVVIEDLVSWTDELSTKYEEIDGQHKELIRLINKLYAGFKQGTAQKEIKQVLKDLVSYTSYHFKTEERFFTEYNYSEADEHIIEHRNLVNQVVAFQKQYEAGTATLSYDLMYFLKDWLEKHILDTDMKYVGKIGQVAGVTTQEITNDERALIVWNTTYETKVQMIDDQHKILVDLINQFYIAFKEGRAKKQIKTILKGLADYTDYHFGIEEQYFKKFKYSAEKEHVALHREFVKKLAEFQDDFNAGKLALSYDIMNFLKDWLVNHILKEDPKYVDLLKNNGIK